MHAEERRSEQNFVLGGYAILETMGAGGMGVVYRAKDVHLGREVALKVLRDDLRNNAHVVARFRREAEAFARLNHPNIVRIYAVGVVGKIPYLAMELIDGEPLNQRLARGGLLDWKDTLDIGLQLADALAAAHEHGVIHRDIKPGNILLGRNGRVYLTDFGIAKVLGAATQLTVDGARLGTPQYLCPERCRNEEITPLSDLYSLGVVLFQVMTGRLPFEAENSVDLIRKIAGEVPERVQTYLPDIPDSVDRFIAHLLDPDPLQRPKDARAFRALLARVRSGDALDALNDAKVSGLRDLRESLPAVATPAKKPAPGARFSRQRMQAAWGRLPRGARWAITAVLALGAATGIGALYQSAASGRGNLVAASAVTNSADAWTVPGPLLRVQPETDTVGTLLIDADVSLGAVLPVAGGNGLLLTVVGIPGSPLSGLQGVWKYEPLSGETRVEVPMMRVTPETPFQVLTAWQDARATTERLLVSTAEGGWILRGNFADRTPLASQPLRLAAAAPDGGRFISQTAGEQLLRLSDLGQPGLAGKTMPAPAVPITACRISGDGRLAVLAFQTSTGEGYSVELQRLTPPMDSKGLSKRAASLPGSPFDTEAARVVLGIALEDGEHVELFDVETGVMLGDLGLGQAPEWVPRKEQVLLLATDYAGRTQVWSTTPANGGLREQQTFIGAGVGDAIAVTADGRYAFAFRAGDTRLVQIEL